MILDVLFNKFDASLDPGVYFLVLTCLVEARVEWQLPVSVFTSFDSVVRGFVYKVVLLNSLMKHCRFMVREDTNEYGDYAVDNRL